MSSDEGNGQSFRRGFGVGPSNSKATGSRSNSRAMNYSRSFGTSSTWTTRANRRRSQTTNSDGRWLVSTRNMTDTPHICESGTVGVGPLSLPVRISECKHTLTLVLGLLTQINMYVLITLEQVYRPNAVTRFACLNKPSEEAA